MPVSTTKSLFLCLVLAALPAFGGQPGVTPQALLYTEFHSNPPAAVLAALQDEVDSIMQPIGFHFKWRSLAGSSGSETSVELAVVNFKGRCDVAGIPPFAGNPGPLGWTNMSNGVILPFTTVECDAIRQFLGKQLTTYPPQQRAEIFGRALGRVLAHELYHIFANTTRHGSDGVGKPIYTVQDLVSTDFRFERREAVALKSSKACAALETAITPPPLNPF